MSLLTGAACARRTRRDPGVEGDRARDGARLRRPPRPPGAATSVPAELLDALALAFGAIVVLYAVIPQSVLDGHAGARAIAYGLRHDLVFVAAYFLGRAVVPQFRRIGVVIVVGAAAVAAWGLIEVYAVPIEWWRHSGAVGYFHRELGYDYHGPAGLPETLPSTRPTAFSGA